MSKKTNSNASRRRLKPSNKDTKFGRDLIGGAKQILAHIEGRKVLDEYTLASPVDVKSIRRKVGMSQTEFGNSFLPEPPYAAGMGARQIRSGHCCSRLPYGH